MEKFAVRRRRAGLLAEGRRSATSAAARALTPLRRDYNGIKAIVQYVNKIC